MDVCHLATFEKVLVSVNTQQLHFRKDAGEGEGGGGLAFRTMRIVLGLLALVG